MTSPHLPKYGLAQFLRQSGLEFIRFTTSNNHQLWRDVHTGKHITIGPRTQNVGAITQLLRRIRRQP